MSNANELQTIIPIVQTIADNKFIIGDRLVEVGISGPDIEATLSAIAMAQAELGHSRLLYNWTFEIQGIKKKPDIKSQTGKAFKQVVEVQNWISLIASLYVINIAIDLVMKEIIHSGAKQIASHFEKYLREQKDHIIYSEGWGMQLLQDQGAIPYRFKEALHAIQDEVIVWLTNIEADKSLIEKGFISENANLADKLNKRIESILLKTGVTASVH